MLHKLKGRYGLIFMLSITLCQLFKIEGLGQIKLNYSGRYYGDIRSNLSSHNPTRNPAYPHLYRTYGYSPSLWNNRFYITLRSGVKGSNFYFHLPLRFRMTGYNHRDETRTTYRPWNTTSSSDFNKLTVGIGGENYSVSLQTGGRDNLYDRTYGFIGDGMLGNFKLANNPSGPILTIKGFNSGDLELTLIGFQTEQTNFIPYPEVMPQDVLLLATGANGEGPLVSIFSGADEGSYDKVTNNLPLYLFSSVKGKNLFQKGDEWGFYFGNKKVVDPGFRFEFDSGDVYKVSKYNGENIVLGYEKKALEFNWKGKIRQSSFAVASSISQSAWNAHYQNKLRKDLGSAGGIAISSKLEDVHIGPLVANFNYRRVAPNYQWVMARHPNYAFVGGPVVLDEMIYDPYWHYRNPNRKEDYLSEVSQYLGIENSNINFSLPGEFLGKSTLFFSRITFNRWLDERRVIPVWDEELKLSTNDDYIQMQTDFETKINERIKAKVGLLNRQYERDSGGWLQSQQLLGTYNNLSGFKYELDLEFRQRFMPDLKLGIGKGYRFLNSLEKKTRNNRINFTIELREGDYDFGLEKLGTDTVTLTPYFYSLMQLNLERNIYFSLGEAIGTITLAGQVWIQDSNSSLATKGIGTVGYGAIRVPWLGGKVVQNFKVISSKGPEDPQFPTGYIVNASDHSLVYNFNGSKNSSIEIRSTYWPGNLGLDKKVITSLVYTVKLSRGQLSLSYGDGNVRDQGEALTNTSLIPTNSVIAQKIAPPIIADNQWRYWYPTLATTVYPRIQYTNYYILQYTVRF